MYFRFATLIALLSAVLATAQSDPNAFKTPTGGWQVTAGEPITLEWTPTTDSTVSLVLRNGAASDLNQGVTIASNLQNSGSYTWTPASNLPRRSDYVIEIVDDSDSSQVNYSPPFIVESTNVIQSTTVTSASASSTTGNSTASSSESSSSSGETPSTTTTGSSGTTVIVSNGTTRTGEYTAWVGAIVDEMLIVPLCSHYRRRANPKLDWRIVPTDIRVGHR